MLFNSLEFSIFLPIVFILYWAIGPKNIRVQNLLILISSYVFYGWWSAEFLILIALSSATDYLIGRGLAHYSSSKIRKLLVVLSLSINIGVLVYFKYSDFFINSFIDSFRFFGYELQPHSLNIILPVGISFYTFQTLSYTLDVYRGVIQPTKNALSFFSYVSFFPQLVAGPIERAKSLLPQFEKQRSFNFVKGRSAARQILWGLFKKIVIADNCAKLANEIFANYQDYDSGMLILGAIYFTFQIYGDFSGYSDIAIGTARLFGFTLMTNFKYPYFSRDIAEFWRRWHISLSTWFRDYLYIPLGGSKLGKVLSIRNIFIIFLISGFWHGANWTFIFWGFLNAAYFLPLFLSGVNRKHLKDPGMGSFQNTLHEILLILVTFCLTVVAWIFFRADSISMGFNYLFNIFDFRFNPVRLQFIKYIPLVVLLLVWEWIMRLKPHGLAFTQTPKPARWGIYLILCFSIIYFFGEEQEFIYFQF